MILRHVTQAPKYLFPTCVYINKPDVLIRLSYVGYLLLAAHNNSENSCIILLPLFSIDKIVPLYYAFLMTKMPAY